MTNVIPKSHTELMGEYLYTLAHGSPEDVQAIEQQLKDLPFDPALAGLPQELLEEAFAYDSSLLEILYSAGGTQPVPTPSVPQSDDDFDLTDRAVTRDERWYAEHLARRQHDLEHDLDFDR